MRPLDKDALEQYIDQYLFDLGFELVDFALDPMGHQFLVTCYIERINGSVTIKDCQVVNEKLKLILEADRLAGVSFSLVISSPGLDRVIKKPADFERFVGREIRVWFPPSEGAKKGRNVGGILEEFRNGKIVLRVESGETLEFALADTKLVRLTPKIDFTPGKISQPPGEE